MCPRLASLDFSLSRLYTHTHTHTHTQGIVGFFSISSARAHTHTTHTHAHTGTCTQHYWHIALPAHCTTHELPAHCTIGILSISSAHAHKRARTQTRTQTRTRVHKHSRTHRGARFFSISYIRQNSVCVCGRAGACVYVCVFLRVYVFAFLVVCVPAVCFITSK